MLVSPSLQFSGTFAGLPCRPCLPNPGDTTQAVFEYVSKLGGALTFHLPLALLDAPLPSDSGDLVEVSMRERHQCWQRIVTGRFTNVLQRNAELVIVPIIDCLPIRLVASLLDLGMSVVVHISIRFTPVSDTSYPLREGMMCCEPYSRRTPSKIGQVGQKLVKLVKN